MITDIKDAFNIIYNLIFSYSLGGQVKVTLEVNILKLIH